MSPRILKALALDSPRMTLKAGVAALMPAQVVGVTTPEIVGVAMPPVTAPSGRLLKVVVEPIPAPLITTVAVMFAPRGRAVASMRIFPRSTWELENETRVSPVNVMTLLPAL